MRHPATPSTRWTRRIGFATVLLVVAFVALLLVFPRADDVSEECRAAREGASAWLKFPSAAKLEEMRRICGSDRE